MPRLFLAVEVPPPVRAAVGQVVAALREEAPQLRWVDPEKYHLTLVFLGRVADERVGDVRAAASSACAGVGAFSLALTGQLGTFRSGVLWAGLEESPALVAVARRLVGTLGDVVELRDADRPFRAHLTLARAPKGGRVPRGLVDGGLPAASWTVDRVLLMESQLSPAGARYSVDTEIALGGGSSS